MSENMDLFIVNRLEDEDRINDVKREDSNLTRLLKKVEKRKKQIQKEANETKLIKEEAKETNVIKEEAKETKLIKEETYTEPKKKRKKKDINKIVSESAATEEITNNIVEGTEEIIQNIERESNGLPHKAIEIDGFTVLGDENFAKRKEVKRVLPSWLSKPTIISVNLQDLQTKITDIPALDANIVQLLKNNRIEYFFPVQAVVIPWLLKSNLHADIIFPRDICVSAPTGSGKTLAFTLPIIQIIKRHTVRHIRAIIILPTQDLALQVFKTFKQYSRGTNVKVCLITGHNQFQTEQEELSVYRDGIGYISLTDVLVCTAGRLVDHIKSTPGFDLTYLEFLAIDEADRVLDNVQNDWLYHLQKHMDTYKNPEMILNLFNLKKRRPPQKLLFSATLSQDPETLQKLSLFQPKLFTSIVTSSSSAAEEGNVERMHSTETFVGKYTTPNELTEKFIVCEKETKPLALYKFIEQEKLTKTMVFTHSLESVHRLAIILRSMLKTYRIEEISSNLQAQQRNKFIKKFSDNEIDLLICTDSMARGMDLPGVKCVISYSAPHYVKNYIHRVGRTARAGETGLAVTLLDTSQLSKFQNMLQQADKSNLEEIKIADKDLEPYIKVYRKALNHLQNEVTTQMEDNLKKIKAVKRPQYLKRKREEESKEAGHKGK